MQALGQGGRDEWIMFNIEQVIHDEPDGLVCGHPVLTIEALQIDRNREAPQRAFAPQVELPVEVTHRQLPQRAIDGLAPAASSVVRFRDGPPASVLAKNGDHVVGVVVGFKIQQ